MGRRTIAIIICLMLPVSSALAAGPLPAGKPAGIKRAQSETALSIIAVGTLAVLAIGGYALSTHPYRLPGSTTATTSTQP